MTASKGEKRQKMQSSVKDEPGAEERFLRGVRKALSTPPKPFTPKTKKTGGKAPKRPSSGKAAK
jgi:hypothetical protein